MTPEPMPERPADECCVYVVTAAGVQAVREATVVVDSEQEAPESNSLAEHPPRVRVVLAPRDVL